MTAGNQFAMFVVIGLVSTILNYAIFYLLLRGVGTYYILASATGFACGACLGFYANRRWTFQSSASPASTAPKFAILYASSLGIGLMTLWFCVETLGISAELGNLATIGISTMVNFVGNKYWVFRDN